MTQPFVVNSCCKINISEECIKVMLKETLPNDTLESCLIHNGSPYHENVKVATYT